MHIYVESRGFAQDDDYRWVQVAEENQRRVEKEDLPAILRSAINLIDSEAFSVVLSRKDDKLLLLVTGLESDGRLDFVERQIRLSVAWICEDSDDDERVLRMLAVTVLDAEKCQALIAQISQAVTLGGETAFAVDFDKMLQLADKQKAQNLLLDGVPDPTKKIAQNSPARQKELSEQLQQYRLPNESGVLVVVTGIKKEETLVNAGVWRGLSSLVKEKDWQPIPVISAEVGDSNKFLEFITRLAAIFGIMTVMELLFKAFNIMPTDKPSELGNTDASKHP